METFGRWLTDPCFRMPFLRAVSFKVYVDSLETIGKDVFEGWLRSMTSLEKLQQLRVVEFEYGDIEESLCWDLRANHQLLVLWRAGDANAPAVVDPAPEYTESCCGGLYHMKRQWDQLSDYNYEGVYIGDPEEDHIEYRDGPDGEADEQADEGEAINNCHYYGDKDAVEDYLSEVENATTKAISLPACKETNDGLSESP